MTGGVISKAGDEASWSIGYGYYYETYEKRDGRWLFTTRRWHNYFGTGSAGVRFPKEQPKGSNAFDSDTFSERSAEAWPAMASGSTRHWRPG